MDAGHCRGSAEGTEQPGPNARAEQPLVKKLKCLEIAHLAFGKVRGDNIDERGEEAFRSFGIDVVRDAVADEAERAVTAPLGFDFPKLFRAARPQVGVTATHPDVERPSNVALLRGREGCEQLHLAEHLD